MDLCPHCGATATTEPDRALRWVCGVCGGARIPGMKLGRQTLATLGLAKSDRGKQRTATVITIGLVVMALFVGAMALLAAATGNVVPAFGAAAIAATDFAMAMAAWSYAKNRGASSRDALDTAWATAAASIARKRGGEITARELAKEMKTSEAEADAILAKLSAGGASVEIDDDAEFHYRVDEAVNSSVDSTLSAPNEAEEPREPANREAHR